MSSLFMTLAQSVHSRLTCFDFFSNHGGQRNFVSDLVIIATIDVKFDLLSVCDLGGDVIGLRAKQKTTTDVDFDLDFLGVGAATSGERSDGEQSDPRWRQCQ